MAILKRRVFDLSTRRQGPSRFPNQEKDLLDELRKSLKRLKALEGLKADREKISKPMWTGEDSGEQVQPLKRSRHVADHRTEKAIAVVIVGLLVAVAAGWVLYSYQIGSNPEPGGPRWKDESISHFTFAAASDFGSDADSFAVAQRARTAGMSFLLALGDLGRPMDEADWCSRMKQSLPELLIVPGNHDVGEQAGGSISEYVKNCPYPLSSSIVPGVGTPGYGHEYYFDYPAEKPLARLIVISAGLEGELNYNYSRHSPHTEWMEEAVDQARGQGISWVIVAAHSQCITVGKKDHCSMGQEIFDELVEAQVDLVLVGHDHAYERSKQLAQSDSCESINATNQFDDSCVVGDGSRGTYPKGEGTVVVVQGVGGERLDNVTLDGRDPEIGYFAEAMGQNANTKGQIAGFGSVFYRVSAGSISVKTDFCPPGHVAPDGGCTANSSQVFEDRFSIGATSVSLAPLTTPGAGAVPSLRGIVGARVESIFALPLDIQAWSSELWSTATSLSRNARSERS